MEIEIIIFESYFVLKTLFIMYQTWNIVRATKV